VLFLSFGFRSHCFLQCNKCSIRNLECHRWARILCSWSVRKWLRCHLSSCQKLFPNRKLDRLFRWRLLPFVFSFYYRWKKKKKKTPSCEASLISYLFIFFFFFFFFFSLNRCNLPCFCGQLDCIRHVESSLLSVSQSRGLFLYSRLHCHLSPDQNLSRKWNLVRPQFGLQSR